MQTIQRLLTDKKDLGRTELDSVDVPYSCADGDVVFKINHVAITTNNISYAAFGDAMNYWGFFPTGRDSKGHMPVWGFADVVASETAGIDVGGRFYGYLPVASYLLVQPDRDSARGFYDGAPHRLDLESAYNQYSRCANDAGYRHDKEHYQSLLRPLFITSYMLVDFLADNDAFGAKHLLFSSASSKTAYGAAYCLKSMLPELLVSALTSPRNISFVESLGLYDKVLAYDDIDKLTANLGTAYVDFAGNEYLRERIHAHCDNMLCYDCFVGSTQNTNFLRDTGLPGPKPEFFFAPVQIKKRNRDYGAAEVTRQFSAAQTEFIDKLHNMSPPWMTIVEHAGFDEAASLIANLASGTSDPNTGNIVVL